MRTTEQKPLGRRPNQAVTVTIAAPPTSGPEYLNWRDGVGCTLRAACIEGLPGPVAIAIRAGIPERPRDLEGISGPLLGTLAAFGVIESEAKAVRIVSEWNAQVERGRVVVEVRQCSSPESFA